jgi:large subunit ribosomal protein L25
MKTLTLTGSPRKTVGKTSTSALRRNGNVPCILYGGKEVTHFETSEKNFKPLVYTPDVHLIKLAIGGKQTDAILKDIQFHPVTDKIMHADFLEVFPDKPVVMNIPVKFIGTPAGVKEGGKLLKKLTRLRVKGLISKIPGAIDMNIESMKIGDYIRIKDLNYEGLTFLHEQNVTIVAVKTARVEVAAETPVAGAAATPAAGTTVPAAGTTPTPTAAATPTQKEEKKDEKKKEKKK